MLNVAVNAKDAMPEGGRLMIATRTIVVTQDNPVLHSVLLPGAYVHLMIRDSGQGMDRDTLSHIFEPFFTTKEEGKGTSLGLATVYGIVKQSQGFIFADSIPAGGTTFDLYFPLVETPVLAAAPAPAARPHVAERPSCWSKTSRRSGCSSPLCCLSMVTGYWRHPTARKPCT